jgi:hypothetical protein
MFKAPQRAVEILGLKIDQKSKDIFLKLKTANGRSLELRLAAGIAAPIAATLFALGRQINPSDDAGISGQHMVLSGVIPLRTPEHQAGLDLVFAGGLHLPVMFPEAVLQILHRAISSLDHTSIDKTPPSTSRN